MATFDAVFVGSGINSLVGAALLAREGWSVCVLERNDVAGGCIRTSTDLTAARVHPRGARVLAPALHRLRRLRRARRASSTARGVVYVNTDLPTGTAFPDGSAAFITGSLEGNVAEFDRLAPGDGAAWERQFNEFMAQRRPRLRDPLDRALVDGRAHARPQGAPPARPPRPARVRRATRSSAAATGSRRRSSRRPPTACSRRGCCTRASGPIRRRPGS